MAPVQFQWFKFLSKTFPLTKSSPTIPALKRVAVDQLMFAPFGGFILPISLSSIVNLQLTAHGANKS